MGGKVAQLAASRRPEGLSGLILVAPAQPTPLDEPVWDVTVFTKNRNRLLEGDVAREFLSQVINQAREKSLTSDEHFTVDGTLLAALGYAIVAS
jgi:pimeloyl-ACP methyl ester carboxylesterase